MTPDNAEDPTLIPSLLPMPPERSSGPQRRSSDHADVVEAWLRTVPRSPLEDVVSALDRIFNTLWKRAATTLGEATLSAVVERVLHDAEIRFPIFKGVVPDPHHGVKVAQLRLNVKLENSQELREGIRWILVQFLTVVGNLTAEILTPALHASLAASGPEQPGPGREPSAQGTPVTPIRAEQVPESSGPGMITSRTIPTIGTGVPNLDLILGGGLPRGSVTIVAGPPGSGKTIFAQQVCFHNAAPDCQVLYFNTLSEPVAKALLYAGQFSFFRREKIDTVMHLVDLGTIMRGENGPAHASHALLEHVKRVKPRIVVVDSFKSFDDFNRSGSEMRKFGYEIAINLMAWETTALLLGEYAADDYRTKPFFSIADGLMTLEHKEVSGEFQGYVQVHKMRGVRHNRDPHTFDIGSDGIKAYTPRLNIKRVAESDGRKTDSDVPRLFTGITGLDALLNGGIPKGSSVLLSGGPGTGKTVLLLDFIYQGAKAGQKGIIFSFEETPERLIAAATGLGWDFAAEMAKGMIEIVFVPQPDIVLEADLLIMQERVKKLGAERIAIDSVSVFLHKVAEKRIAQEKIFQIATIVQSVNAVGFFATDIPYGTDLLSRFGIEETIVDGVILLTATEEGLMRRRYLEVYKLRNTAHTMGRHDLVIGSDKVAVFPAEIEGNIKLAGAPVAKNGPKNGSKAAPRKPVKT